MKYKTLLAGIALVMLFCGCAGPLAFLNREDAADNIAFSSGFTRLDIVSGPFTLTTYSRIISPGKPLRIYIEGDGCAWESRHVLSEDPTPSNPVALYLATADPYDNIAYLARPGQYQSSSSKKCDPVYWSDRRFSPEVIDSANRAVDRLKQYAEAPGVEIVGYSGGGAIAVLVAANRQDVTAIRTVAANLDWKKFCEYHKVSPLTGSLNPPDIARKVAHIPQHHFFGKNDKTAPASIAEGYIKAAGSPDTVKTSILDGVTHSKGWRERWPGLLDLYPAQTKS